MAINCSFSLQRKNFSLELELNIPANGISAITGPSGSGKTTLLRVLSGLEYIENARVQVGSNVWQDESRFVPTHKRSIAYVFQRASLFSHLNVIDNINYARKRSSSKVGQQEVDDLIDLLAIRPLLDRRTNELSGGEQQRVAIARALAISPQLLLMDEPLSSLDLQKRHEVLPFLERLHDQLSIPMLYVSHEPEEIIRLADYLVIIKDGRLEVSGTLEEVMATSDSFIAHGDKAVSIIQAKVTANNAEYGLTTLSFPGGHLALIDQELMLGKSVRLRVFASDVSLSLSKPSNSSAINIVDARIVSLSPQGNTLLVSLLAQGTPLLARITRQSGDILGLCPGKEVYAQVNALELLS